LAPALCVKESFDALLLEAFLLSRVLLQLLLLLLNLRSVNFSVELLTSLLHPQVLDSVLFLEALHLLLL
jgi:hypothetical protein